eukprot:16048-Heterococcus_DN1.PRE.1
MAVKDAIDSGGEPDDSDNYCEGMDAEDNNNNNNINNNNSDNNTKAKNDATTAAATGDSVTTGSVSAATTNAVNGTSGRWSSFSSLPLPQQPQQQQQQHAVLLPQEVGRSASSTIKFYGQSIKMYRHPLTSSGSSVVQPVTSQSVLPHFQEQFADIWGEPLNEESHIRSRLAVARQSLSRVLATTALTNLKRDLTGGCEMQITSFIAHHLTCAITRSDGDEVYKPGKGKKNTKKKKTAAVKRTRCVSEPAESSEPEADGATLGLVPCSLMPHVLRYCSLRELSKLWLLDRAFNTEAMNDKHYLDKRGLNLALFDMCPHSKQIPLRNLSNGWFMSKARMDEIIEKYNSARKRATGLTNKRCCVCNEVTSSFSVLKCAYLCQICFRSSSEAKMCSLNYAKAPSNRVLMIMRTAAAQTARVTLFKQPQSASLQKFITQHTA